MGQLRDRMDHDMALRGMSANTRKTYLCCAALFAEYFGRSPTDLGAEHVRLFVLHLMHAKQYAASTYEKWTTS